MQNIKVSSKCQTNYIYKGTEFAMFVNLNVMQIEDNKSSKQTVTQQYNLCYPGCATVTYTHIMTSFMMLT